MRMGYIGLFDKLNVFMVMSISDSSPGPWIENDDVDKKRRGSVPMIIDYI